VDRNKLTKMWMNFRLKLLILRRQVKKILKKVKMTGRKKRFKKQKKTLKSKTLQNSKVKQVQRVKLLLKVWISRLKVMKFLR